MGARSAPPPQAEPKRQAEEKIVEMEEEELLAGQLPRPGAAFGAVAPDLGFSLAYELDESLWGVPAPELDPLPVEEEEEEEGGGADPEVLEEDASSSLSSSSSDGAGSDENDEPEEAEPEEDENQKPGKLPPCPVKIAAAEPGP